MASLDRSSAAEVMTEPHRNRNPEAPDLITSSFTYWVAAGIAFMCSLIRGKVTAVHLGPAGIGLISQLNSISILIGSLSTLGLGNATVKLIARARAAADDHQFRRLATFVVVTPVLASTIFVAAGMVMAHQAAAALLGSAASASYIAIATLSVPFNLAAGGIQVVLQGMERMIRLSSASIIATLLNTGAVIGLVAAFGLAGGVTGVLATSVIALTVLLVRERWIIGRLTARWHPGRAAVREMVRYGTASVVLVILGAATDTFLRGATIARLGLTANGVYQPVIMLSSQVFLQIQTGIAMFLLPALSRAVAQGGAEAARGQLDRALRLAVITTVAVSLCLIAGRTPMLHVLFTGDFLPAADLIPLQLIGELFRACAYVMGAVLLPAGRLRAWLTIGVLTLGAQLVLGLALLPVVGLRALPIAFTVSWALNLVANVTALRPFIRVAPKRPTVISTFVGMTLLTSISLATVATKSGLLDAVTALAAVAWVLFVVSKAERKRALELLRTSATPIRQATHTIRSHRSRRDVT
jgi:PST family polysaccharide transporter